MITGGDSGIGRAVVAVAFAFAKEGADVAIAYLSERDNARHTVELVEAQDRVAREYIGDLADPEHCAEVVARTADELGGLDTLVNNAAFQSPVEDFLDLTAAQWRPVDPGDHAGAEGRAFRRTDPYGRAAQPDEIAPSYVFFVAEQLSSYYTGEVLAPLGGETLPG